MDNVPKSGKPYFYVQRQQKGTLRLTTLTSFMAEGVAWVGRGRVMAGLRESLQMERLGK